MKSVEKIKNLLIVDDDELMSFLLGDLLDGAAKVEQYQIMTSGYEAIEFLKESRKNGIFPDYILVDINMPEMDGFEFVARYEELFYEQYPDTILAMLSSSILASDKLHARSYKAVKEFLSKPLTENTLVNLLVFKE